MSVPGGWEFTLLLLAAFRVTRLIGWDDITKPIRERLFTRRVGGVMDSIRPKAQVLVLERHNTITKLLKCPWCLGWWVSVLWWGAWLMWPHGTLVAATPWALSAMVGLVARNLDP